MERDPRHYRNDIFSVVPTAPTTPEPSLLGFKGFKKATRMAGRNHACPCGSGKKYKKCCRRPGG